MPDGIDLNHGNQFTQVCLSQTWKRFLIKIIQEIDNQLVSIW